MPTHPPTNPPYHLLYHQNPQFLLQHFHQPHLYSFPLALDQPPFLNPNHAITSLLSLSHWTDAPANCNHSYSTLDPIIPVSTRPPEHGPIPNSTSMRLVRYPRDILAERGKKVRTINAPLMSEAELNRWSFFRSAQQLRSLSDGEGQGTKGPKGSQGLQKKYVWAPSSSYWRHYSNCIRWSSLSRPLLLLPLHKDPNCRDIRPLASFPNGQLPLGLVATVSTLGDPH